MTLAEVASPARGPVSSSRRRGRRWAVGASIGLLLLAGGVTGATYYYDSVPFVENAVSYPEVAVTELPDPVADAFVAAVDPDFHDNGDSLITRRYAVLGSDDGGESGWRARVLVDKVEARFTKEEILGRYLTRADFGRGAVGLDAAARTYFQKPPARLTVAEAALLAVQLDPDRPEPRAGWGQVLDTMVERGWLSPAERNGLAFPG